MIPPATELEIAKRWLKGRTAVEISAALGLQQHVVAKIVQKLQGRGILAYRSPPMGLGESLKDQRAVADEAQSRNSNR